MELTAANTAIVLDSTADFPEATARFANWRIVPLYVRFGSESFRDYVDLDPGEFYARLRASDELPTTSQPTPADFLAVYEELAGYERVLSLHISGRLSGTIESARTAAAEAGERVRVLDSDSASVGLAAAALGVQRLLDRGTTDDEVDALVDRYRRDARLLFTVETLEYLAKGGRIGKARAMAGQLLHVKPILELRGGEVLPIKRVRGNAKAFAAFVEAFRGAPADSPGLRFAIVHAGAPEKAARLAEMAERERPGVQVELVTALGPVVGTHAGPGAVGFFWIDGE